MKKSKMAVIASLCLTPLMLLTACTPTESYLISASSSDSSLGYVYGQFAEEKEEGSKVTINAVPKAGNTFVCWIKDNKKIASEEAELELTYNESTAGRYTAVFQESDSSKMQYASFANIDFAPEGYTKVQYKISTALLSIGSDEYSDVTDGEYSVGDTSKIGPTSVIYFGGAGRKYNWSIKINFKLFDAQNNETTFEYVLDQNVNKDTFNEKAGLKICEEIAEFNDAKVTITFDKLTTAEVTDYEKIGEVEEPADPTQPVTPPVYVPSNPSSPTYDPSWDDDGYWTKNF